VSKNLGCQKPVVSLEDYRIAPNRQKIHEITMEGLKDILIKIWEKIKAFFRSLLEKILLFARRLIGLEPNFQYLERYISNNINKIKSRNLMLMDKNQKVQTNIVKYLAPYEVSDFNENHIWVIGVPKINQFINVIDYMIKYSKMNNESQIINNIKGIIESKITPLRNLQKSVIEFHSTYFNNLTHDRIIEKIKKDANIEQNPRTFIWYVNETEKLISEVITGIGNELKTDELLATTFNLKFGVSEREVPYTEVHNAIEIMRAKIDTNDVTINGLYRCTPSSLSSPNILNLNIISIVGNGTPQSNVASQIDNDILVSYKYSDYLVVKNSNVYINDNLFYAIADIHGIEKLFGLYKEIKNLPIDNVYKNMKQIEDKLNSMTKVFDDFIQICSDIAEILLKTTQLVIALSAMVQNKEGLDEETKRLVSERLILLIGDNTSENNAEKNDPVRKLNKTKMELIKLMEYHRRNLTNSTGKVMTELLSIRSNFLRDLGYYIYRSTEKYS